MTSAVIPFAFDALTVRAVLRDGEPWFVASDVCEALTINNVTDAVSRLDDDERTLVTIEGGSSNGLPVNCINESGLYSLTLTSRKPEAKRFKKWITSEVLPSIRKTGSYSLTKPAPSRMEILQLAMEAELARIKAEEERDYAIATKAEIGTRREATAMATASVAVRQVEKLRVELDESKQWATVKRMEMAYHGQKFNWRMVKAASAELGLPTEQVFDANYGTVNAYHADAWRAAYAVEIL